jgi:hypothetical protein
MILSFNELLPLAVFAFLADVEALYRSMIAHNSGVYSAFGPFRFKLLEYFISIHDYPPSFLG